MPNVPICFIICIVETIFSNKNVRCTTGKKCGPENLDSVVLKKGSLCWHKLKIVIVNIKKKREGRKKKEKKKESFNPHITSTVHPVKLQVSF